jgi:hypothetical protein
MLKKLFILILITLLYLSCITITDINIFVNASSGDDIYLDTQYIYDITYNLSDVINIVYNNTEIAKGRFFGSKGERYAAEEILQDEMIELNLYDPTGSNDPSYLDRITNITIFDGFNIAQRGLINLMRNGNLSLTYLRDITEKELILNHSGDPEPVDCFMTATPSESTDSINWTDLKIIKTDNYDCTDDYIKNVTLNIGLQSYNITLENLSKLNELEYSIVRWHIRDLIRCNDIDILMEEAFEQEYNFTFGQIDPSDDETFPTFLSTIDDVDDGFVFFEEYRAFNPDIRELPSLQSSTDFKIFNIWHYAVRGTYISLRLRAWNETYGDKLKGVLYYDYDDSSHNVGGGSNNLTQIFINGSIGEKINESVEDYKIDVYQSQIYNTTIESYNVIGEIKADPVSDKYVLVQCLYDSQWCQGTVDSGIGVGIVFAIAKYMKEHDIKPKYNIRFVLYGGEEAGFRGVWHYEANYYYDKILWVIDLNQLGYNQTIPTLLNVGTNDKDFLDDLNTIFDKTNYPERVNDGTELDLLYTPFGSESNDMIYAFAKEFRLTSSRSYLTTIMFLKDGLWYRHHRDGMNHSEGDSMNYYNPVDVALTSELVWNLTKYICINPDCWFESKSYELLDSPYDNDSYYDTINISYKVNTSLPHDRILVKAELYWNDCVLSNLRIKNRPKVYMITPETGVQDNLTIQLPLDAPQGNYTLRLHLFNSTGEIKDNIYNPYDLYFRNWLCNNELYMPGPFYMAPANIAPDNFENLYCKQGNTGKAGTKYSYTTSTNDTEGNQIYYQFEFGNKTKGYEYTPWIGPYNSSENCTITHTWTTTGNMTVRARARDENYAPRYWTNWTQPLNQTIKKGCTILAAPTNILVNTSFEVQGKTYNFTAINWSWNWDDGQEPINFTKNATHTYNQTDTYTINLTVKEYETTEYYYETDVNVLPLISKFNTSDKTIQTNVTVNFTDQSTGEYTINNWTWNLGDGNIYYDQNTSHNYSIEGTYNVTLTVKDNQNNNHTSNQTIYVDSTNPKVVDALYTLNPKISQENNPYMVYFGPAGYLNNVTIYADFFDDLSGVQTTILNITSPNGTWYNETMNTNSNIPQDYEYIFSDIGQIGQYNTTFGVIDNANNSNYTIGNSFNINHMFGNMLSGNKFQNISDNITGTVFTVKANGTADNISVYIQTNLTIPPKTKCMIYRYNDSKLIGTTNELTPNTGSSPEWITYNFSDPKPQLVENTLYVLTCWSNDTCDLYYDDTSLNLSRYKNETYGTPPNTINWTDNKTHIYSIYCRYTTTPEITNIVDSPETVGFGYNVTINADIQDFGCGSTVYVNITYPDNNYSNYSMSNAGNDTYKYVFNNTWLAGQHNYTIWTIDRLSTINSSSGHSFNVSAQATITVSTIKAEYGDNETVNLTDPPGSPPSIGYELLDNNQVLHMWNTYNSYYFNTSNGIQLTNHKDEYWTHNVLMLGYYNNDTWNLIYRTDNLSGFNKNIKSDNETYVNATLWKDLSYGGYDFRLAIRYYLGVDDVDLTVIPYIKNLDEDDISYTLGFGWEIKDIRIANVTNDNYLRIYNGSGFEDILLNQSLDNSYTNMGNNTVIRLICKDPPTYHLSRDLYLSWDSNLTYKVTVKSRSGQYNAPVTLFIRVGNLSVGQEKYTMMHWLDSDDWFGVDSSVLSDSCEGQSQDLKDALDGKGCWDCPLDHDHWFVLDLGHNLTVKKFRGRSITVKDPTDVDIYVSTDSSRWDTAVISDISSWQDTSNWQEEDSTDKIGRYIKVVVEDTECVFMPRALSWGDSLSYMSIFDFYGDVAPDISNPYPANGSIGASVAPMLNITVSDPDSELMNIKWYSNSSGGWEVFGSNNSVGDGTYHQVFSNASVNGQWWYWNVSVTDSSGHTVDSDVFKFYTGYESKIVNTGSHSFKGYLLMQVQFYNTTTGNWTVADDTINETSPRIINYNGTSDAILALDTIFNGNVSSSDLLDSFGDGTYRIYAAFRDPDGDVLVCDDESLLETTYEFSITSS